MKTGNGSSNVVRQSVSIDNDLIEPAKDKSRQYSGRFDKPNLSAYINALLRKDLGLNSKEATAADLAQDLSAKVQRRKS